jgi:hypothetical protein
MGKDDDGSGSLNEAQLNELVQHLQTEEEASRESALESEASFQLWLANHPALRQMAVVESFSQIGPAILQFLRALLGLDRGKGEAPETGQEDKGDARP